MDNGSKYLILIVGENPLPVYIAAINGCRNKSVIYLVYTDEKEDAYGSEFFAKSIKDTLYEKKNNIKIKLKGTDRSEAGSVTRTAQEIIEDIARNFKVEDSIFFYYNGGTKVMDNYFYCTLKDLEDKNSKFRGKIIYQYQYKAKLNEGKEIGIRDICSIHGYKLKNKDSDIITKPGMEIVKHARLEGPDNNIEFNILVKEGEKIRCINIVDNEKKNECKFKLFKTIYDAEKVGGSRVEVDFYCRCNKMGELQNEVDNMRMDELKKESDKKRIKVFNLEDMIINRNWEEKDANNRYR